MISLILTESSSIRDTLVNELQLIRDPHIADSDKVIYRRKEWVLVFAPINLESIEWAGENYLPEYFHIAYIGRSLSPDHRIGDVILPDVFFSYNTSLPATTITKENRDALIGKATFLDAYTTHADYLSDGFGISVGGIVLSNAPSDPDDELITKLGIVYEADVMIEGNLSYVEHLVKSETYAIQYVFGVTSGRLTDIPHGMSEEVFAIKNILTTIKFMKEEGN